MVKQAKRMKHDQSVGSKNRGLKVLVSRLATMPCLKGRTTKRSLESKALNSPRGGASCALLSNQTKSLNAGSHSKTAARCPLARTALKTRTRRHLSLAASEAASLAQTTTKATSLAAAAPKAATRERRAATPKASTRRSLAAATPKAGARRPLTQTTSKVARMALALLLVTTMTMPLAGCKETDVLTQTILDQSAEYTDESLTPVRVEATTDNIDSITDENKGESDSADDQVEDDPSYDDSADADGDTSQRLHADETTGQDNASEGTANSDSTRDGESSVSEADGSDNTSSGEGDGESSSLSEGSGNSSQSNNQSTSETQGPGNTSQGSNSSGSGGSSGTLYGSDGVYDELPSGSSIAARGELATLVAAIGGGSTLGCTSEEWLQTAQSKNVFPGELSNVQTAWSGDGSTSDTLDVDAVIASGVDVLLCASDEITQDQCDELIAAGIDVVAMPVLGEVDTLDEDIETAAQVVGEVLRKATDGASSAMAEQYISMRTSALEVLYNDNGGLTTYLKGGTNHTYVYQGRNSYISNRGSISPSSNRMVVAYVDSWLETDETTTTEQRTLGGSLKSESVPNILWPSTVGSPYLIGTYSETALLDITEGYGLSPASSGRVSSNFALFDYYLQYAGAMDIHGLNITSLGNVSRTSQGPYIGTGTSSGIGYIYRVDIAAFLSRFESTSSGGTSGYFALGDDVFPAIITRTTGYAEKIVASAAKGNGYYNIGRAYEVWVLPSGLDGSWADGSMESYLSALWAAGKLDGDVNKYVSYVNEFYSTFFRCGAAEVVENWDTTYEIAVNRT